MTIKNIVYNQSIKFILSGGKGGVGKTSAAGAMAVLSAKSGLRTLVLSTDPAHSLSDSFKQDLSGGEIIPVEGIDNLWGMEISSEKGMQDFQNAMDGGGTEMEMASQLLGSIGDMTPPGSDEAMAFGKILEFLDDMSYDRVIFDTAPTGHTLKLLELPELLDSWLGKVITMRQRLSSTLAGIRAMLGGREQEETAWEMLQQTKEKIKSAKLELQDQEKTQFVIVMIPEAMAVFETQRLLSSLNTWNIPMNNIVVNQLIPENPGCEFCSSRRQMQQRNLVDIRDLYQDIDIVEVPLLNTEIVGIDSLENLGRILIGEDQ